MQHIEKIIIEGFQTIEQRTEIPLDRLTLSYGPNSSGKVQCMNALIWC